MKQYKYWSEYTKDWKETDLESTAINNSYHSHKPYYKNVNGKWILKDIPDALDLSNTDTFHVHELKGKRNS